MASVSKLTPFVVPLQTTHATPAILQADLAHIIELRRTLETVEADLEAAEQAIRAQLEAGAVVEGGLFRAFLKACERRNVSWKAVVERELGEDYSRRVLAATKPDRTVSLVVEA